MFNSIVSFRSTCISLTLFLRPIELWVSFCAIAKNFFSQYISVWNFYKKHNVCPIRNYNYTSPVVEFNFVSLRKRKKISGAVFAFKLINDQVDSMYFLSLFFNFNTPRIFSRANSTFKVLEFPIINIIFIVFLHLFVGLNDLTSVDLFLLSVVIFRRLLYLLIRNLFFIHIFLLSWFNLV